MPNSDAPRAACADRLDLVDGAFKKADGPEARALKHLCRDCPIAKDCLMLAMARHEHGVWGRTTANQRTMRGAPGSPQTEARRRAS